MAKGRRPRPEPSKGEVIALHRYFVWADRMRVHLDAIPPGTGATEALFSHPYLSYWYGGMYVVIEGWQRLGLHDPEVDDLLTSDNVKHLERHRHGAFHYHMSISTTSFSRCSLRRTRRSGSVISAMRCRGGSSTISACRLSNGGHRFQPIWTEQGRTR